MKITDQTTLAELEAYLRTIGEPELAVVRARRSCMAPGKPDPHAYHAVAYLPAGRVFHGGGNTIAEAIEDALAGLRAASGITNLAYEPLNHVREKPVEGES
jgi:hypothetical protein